MFSQAESDFRSQQTYEYGQKCMDKSRQSLVPILTVVLSSSVDVSKSPAKDKQVTQMGAGPTPHTPSRNASPK